MFGFVFYSKNVIEKRFLHTYGYSQLRYSGFLTTPPCTEDVTWLMITTPTEASIDQLEAFSHLLGNNARPLQRLGS